ncbi:MAG: NapC/NirT family cytochrome c [Ignavibacteriaceae bacterium]|nr:NapC/NirT family cytochrome c [Ignavibacteriaceae bacterium]
MKNKLPSSVYNPLSLAGAAIALISFGLILFLFVLELFGTEQKPYMGIIAFVILPGILIVGLLLIAYGIYREKRRERKGILREKNFPVIDLNNPKHRTAVTIFSAGTILLLLFSAFGSFKAYEYTDSDEFCGTICHEVMEPEYTAYKSSPHSKVGCVKCHIGPGAGWFVRSKLSGAYQVYSVLFNKYPRPIATPVHSLRPARETCEQCHWPEHFYSEKKHQNTYFLSDENNTKWQITLLMKIGGGNNETGNVSGIHWHIQTGNEITYISTDSTREVIPWVHSKTKDGKEEIFISKESELTQSKMRTGVERKMDCIDCHNRPSHQYHAPAMSINHLMAINWIDNKLPYIKSVGMNALEKTYTKNEVALDSIKIMVEEFYAANFPEVAVQKKPIIKSAINQLQKIYSRNYFPRMQVSWRKYPDHIGHMYSSGCFRCHDGKHFTKEGKVISKDCNLCHTIVAQQFDGGTKQFSLGGINYQHPVDIGNEWFEMNCSDCHSRKKTEN